MGSKAAQPAARVGDIDTGHDTQPPTAITTGSPDVLINGLPAARFDDELESHGCIPDEPRRIIEGAGSVLINGKPAARVTDAVDCGGTLDVGSKNVSIGDSPR
ncbi:MAG: PAAR domain-containing protein [Gammaproteobacteria bacterium]|nr:PAAR domain-containing protein [Gammaproteobacteria bacterium]